MESVIARAAILNMIRSTFYPMCAQEFLNGSPGAGFWTGIAHVYTSDVSEPSRFSGVDQRII